MALDPGWAQTSISGAAVSLSFTLELKAQTTVGGARVDRLFFFTRDASLATDFTRSDLWTGTGNAANSWSTVEVVMQNGVTGTETVITSGSGAALGEPGWLPTITIEKEWTGLRLGVTIREGVLVYAWFTDSGSSLVTRVAGTDIFTETFGTPAQTSDGWISPFFGATQVYRGQGPMLSFEAAPFNNTIDPSITGQSTYEHVRFGSFTANGDALSPPYAVVYKATAVTSEDPLRLMAHSVGAPFEYTLDADCDETSGASVAADFTHADAGPGVCPTTLTAQVDFFDGSGFDSFAEGHIVPAAVLADSWLSAQTVRPYDADLAFRCEGMAPRTPDSASRTDYSTGSITIASPVNVLNSSTAWATDLGTVAIGGTPTVPIFTTTATPAIVSRNLAESWRDWNTVGHPDEIPGEGYLATKHDAYPSGAADDSWGVSAYSYADFDLTVPAGSDSELAIEITYAVLRGVSTIDTIVVNYSPVIFPAGGRSTQRVDLMFPVELASRPLYAERVDKIRLVGLQMGVTTLHSISLVGVEDSYLTASGRRSVLRDGTVAYSGLVLTQDGAAPSLLWGRDTAVSPLAGDLDLDGWTDFRGDHQNGAFLVNAVTQEHPGKAPGMLAGTLEATLLELHRMEGVTASYSAAAITAAFTDGDLNVLGTDAVGNPATVTRGADWFLPTLPADRIASGVPYDVRAQVVVSGVVVPAGVDPGDLILFQRNHLGMTLEGLATDADYMRHGAGVTVTARGYTGGAPAAGDQVLGAELTDASGFAPVPIRTGTLSGSQFSAYLGA